jgi:hypothetical protein
LQKQIQIFYFCSCYVAHKNCKTQNIKILIIKKVQTSCLYSSILRRKQVEKFVYARNIVYPCTVKTVLYLINQLYYLVGIPTIKNANLRHSSLCLSLDLAVFGLRRQPKVTKKCNRLEQTLKQALSCCYAIRSMYVSKRLHYFFAAFATSSGQKLPERKAERGIRLTFVISIEWHRQNTKGIVNYGPDLLVRYK